MKDIIFIQRSSIDMNILMFLRNIFKFLVHYYRLSSSSLCWLCFKLIWILFGIKTRPKDVPRFACIWFSPCACTTVGGTRCKKNLNLESHHVFIEEISLDEWLLVLKYCSYKNICCYMYPKNTLIWLRFEFNILSWAKSMYKILIVDIHKQFTSRCYIMKLYPRLKVTCVNWSLKD